MPKRYKSEGRVAVVGAATHKTVKAHRDRIPRRLPTAARIAEWEGPRRIVIADSGLSFGRTL